MKAPPPVNLNKEQPVNEGALPPRTFLYTTAALSGAAVMIVEILGAKMLSPFVGTSHFVWTAQIAVTLIALAVGYYFGGRLADQSQSLTRLYGALLAAGVYLALTVPLCKPIAYWCLQFSLPIGSLLASLFLFFVPLALLAITGPFLIRVLTGSVGKVGVNVGQLSAISTLGSFVGTVLIGYLLIPFFPNTVTMGLTALLLMLLGALYFVLFRRRVRQMAGLLVLIGGVELISFQGLDSGRLHPIHGDELYYGNSNFGQLQVIQMHEGGYRFYLNDYLTQNTYDTNSGRSISMFTYMLHELPRAYSTNLSDVLCIGLGVGIVPMEFAQEGAHVEVVEINPAIVPVGQAYFHLDPAQLQIHIADGRQFLNQCQKQYDAVVLDAFLGDSSPSHLLSREAFGEIRRVLRPEGVLVINTFASLIESEDFFAASLSKTLRAVFPAVQIHHAVDGNTLFVASSRSPLTFLRATDFSQVHPACRNRVEEGFAGLRETNPAHGRVLTDDYNPLEFYDAANRERVRKRLAQDVKDL